MESLDHYIKLFSKLKRSPHAVWGAATKKKAPHKPILLLSVIDLISRGLLQSNFFDLSKDLSELNDLFNSYWFRVVPLGQTSSIAFPFTHLHSEGFWKLVPIKGGASDFSRLPNITTIRQLKDIALGAEIEKDLYECMQTAVNRSALRQALLKSCFSEDAQKKLEHQAMINAEAYSYSLELLQKSHEPLVSDIVKDSSKPEPVRDQAFRRVVVITYDHRCALCGVRMVTPDGHTAVDAAHIKPWSISKNDDVRNGMALCKLCHWTFDEGFIGVSASYTVLVSRQLSSGPNMPGLLSTLDKRSIITPIDKELWPAQEYLEWHRREYKLDN
jgi:putative restriction endonuclease